MAELHLTGTSAGTILQANNSITSNQTFTFPDVGGELIVNAGPAITVTPGSRWSGTVSQNGAGSPMETGSDSDGNTWIKFADGTMMITTEEYLGNVGGSTINVTLPQAFVDTNYAWFATQSLYHGDANYGMSTAWEGGNRTTTSFDARCQGFTTGGSPVGFTFLVIGRWYS